MKHGRRVPHLNSAANMAILASSASYAMISRPTGRSIPIFSPQSRALRSGAAAVDDVARQAEQISTAIQSAAIEIRSFLGRLKIVRQPGFTEAGGSCGPSGPLLHGARQSDPESEKRLLKLRNLIRNKFRSEEDGLQRPFRVGLLPPAVVVQPARRLSGGEASDSLWTNTSLPSPLVGAVSTNKRGTAGQWIKEGKQATDWTRLSCHRFPANEVRLQLAVLAYNLGNLWRRLGLPHRIKTWSLTSLQQRLMKTGGRLVKHPRYYWLLLVEGQSQPGDCSATCCGGSGRCRCRAGNITRSRINSFWLKNIPQGAVSAGAPFSPLNQRLVSGRASPGALLAEVMCRVQRKKAGSFGAARCYAVTVPGPRWKA